ncbi:hypothetical protein ADIARSV_2373 [Arcticibacter svalbardensis MN12-7]|uniref:Uncharacterized protein n=1 Tax=Arcticibacter svalbardensis MN12-7 TaxID=1150600 RepID=R9GRP9_9SPHI|nr:hypothetical protein [Arcticibacter svalbardensis]EOR94527.1 hypothetical protein ADIARSV_2373 [Arcticibacter svalbardensis MN12-7]
MKKLVYFPKGNWRSDKGEIIKGPKRVEQSVALNRLPVYELVKD